PRKSTRFSSASWASRRFVIPRRSRGICFGIALRYSGFPRSARNDKAWQSAMQRLVARPVRARTFLAQPPTLVRFVFLVIADKEAPLRIVFGGEDMRCDAVQEPAIVGDDQHAAGELEQRFFQ